MKKNTIFKTALLNYQQTLKLTGASNGSEINRHGRNFGAFASQKNNLRIDYHCKNYAKGHLLKNVLPEFPRIGNRNYSSSASVSTAAAAAITEDPKSKSTSNSKVINPADEHLWVRSTSEDVETAVGRTIAEAIWDTVRQYGNNPAFECAITGRKYTFNEIYRHSRGFAASLIKAGVNRNDIIGFVLPNIPEYPICLMGSWDAGCIVSPVNPAYTPEEIKRQLITSEAKIVVTIEYFLDAVLSAKEFCPMLETIIVIGANVPQGCQSFFEFIKTDPTGYEQAFLHGSEINALDSVALLPFSSGTTGPPKGVMLTHSNLTTNMKQYLKPDTTIVNTPENSLTKEPERLIGLLPFFHAYGMNAVMVVGLVQGANTICLPRFEPKSFLDTIKKHRPTVMHLVTPLISFLTQTPECGRAELEAVHSILGAAAPIGSVLIHKMLEKSGKYIFFQEGYGMTELSPLSHVLKPSMKHTKIGSCGSPVASTICKVIDIETGKTLGPNERGELLVRGPQVMKGYFKNEKATAETIDSEGWLHTGDICYYDEDSHFYIVDRLKELIKVKGFQVAPSELEDILRDHPQVGDVAVIGVPNEEWGELPRAYVVKKDSNLSEDVINNYLVDKIASYKQLRGGIEFVDTIPKAPSGKILRRELVAAYKKDAGIAS